METVESVENVKAPQAGGLDSLFTYNGELDDVKTQEWLDFMFLNEPVANFFQSYCHSRGISESKMYQLIALWFMAQKTEKMTKEWLKVNFVL